MKTVRLFKPSVGKEEIDAIQEVFDISWLGLGEKVAAFEKAWSEYLGCKESVGLNSGTAALHLALASYKFARGKKVLVPALTFVSTAAAPLYCGLDPIFVDVNPDTLQIDPRDLAIKYTPDCVAIMVVHFGGHPAPMPEIMEFARKKELKVIEDCAHTQGGRLHGIPLGLWGDIGCFSFEEKKGMTTGDGGMACSNKSENLELLKPMRWVGIDKDTWKRSQAYTQAGLQDRHWYYEIAELGYKYNMNNLAAAIGLAQLKKLPQFNASKRNAISRYLHNLSKVPGFRPLLPYSLDEHASYWLFGIKTQKRDALIQYLKTNGIATGVHYTPLTMQPLFQNHAESTPQATKVYDEILTLPLHPELTDEEIDYVCAKIQQFGML